MSTKIKVVYWVGTTQMEATAKTYSGAMKIASRNSNACSTRFYAEDGEQLVDLGGCLVRVSDAEKNPAGTTPIMAYA